MSIWNQVKRAEERNAAEDIEIDNTVEVPRQRGRPKSGRVVTTLRLDPDIIETLKSQGPGWQSRANALLRTALGL